MTVKQIYDIIKRHTGPNANDHVKIPHEEVVAMIRAAKDGGRIPVGARNALLSALTTFGGNEIHPNIFSSAADKAALAATAMDGIETADKFAQLPAKSQFKFIRWSLSILMGEVVGFQTVNVRLADLPQKVQDGINATLASQRSKAGAKFADVPSVTIQGYQRNQQFYGFECNAFWPTTSGDGGEWAATFYVDQNGATQIASSDFEPPEEE